jgi:hypothetical protein
MLYASQKCIQIQNIMFEKRNLQSFLVTVGTYVLIIMPTCYDNFALRKFPEW